MGCSLALSLLGTVPSPSYTAANCQHSHLQDTYCNTMYSVLFRNNQHPVQTALILVVCASVQSQFFHQLCLPSLLEEALATHKVLMNLTF